jgi:hypothetical protein
VNLSTRAFAGTGSNIVIAGFVISGGGSESLLIRADGPSLNQFGLSGTLTQPILSLFDAKGNPIATNIGWANNSQIASSAVQVGAFPFASGSTDSALIVNLPAGSYTAEVSGVNNSTGITLVEIYETSSTGTRLVNISTRANPGTGSNVMIAGFVISGSSPEELLVRADGPSLAQFGVTGTLAQPSLNLSGNGVNISNTGWGTSSNSSQIATAAASVNAFALPVNSADSALLTTLNPGAYTAEVVGVNGSTGVALVEVYEIP